MPSKSIIRSAVMSAYDVGKILGTGKDKVERWLRTGTCPFGYAIAPEDESTEKWKYIIAKEAFEHWLKYGTCPVVVKMVTQVSDESGKIIRLIEDFEQKRHEYA